MLGAGTRDVINRFVFHSDWVSAVKFTSSSQLLSASWDETIALWNLESREAPCIIFRGHRRKVNDIAMSSDGSKTFSASNDGTVQVWDKHSGRCIKTAASSKSQVCSVLTHGDTLGFVTCDSIGGYKLCLQELKPNRGEFDLFNLDNAASFAFSAD